MTKKTEREVARLNRLADYIESNPDKFELMDTAKCIVGIGNRLARKKESGWKTSREVFGKWVGLSFDVVTELYVGAFNDLNKRYKYINLGNHKIGVRQTVGILRWIAKEKAKGKILKSLDNYV
jgi:hypothetical protein